MNTLTSLPSRLGIGRLARFVPDRFRPTPRDERPAPAIGRYAHRHFLRRYRWLCFLALTVFALLYGFAFALFGRYLLVQLTAPLVVLTGITLWVLPDMARVPERWLPPMLTVFVFGLLCWPDYIAFAVPGLPWVTMTRLTGVPLTIILLVCVSCSAAFRARIAEICSATPWLWKLLVAFMVIAGLSIALSSNIVFSINRYVLALYSWAAVFVVATYVFVQPGRIRRFAYYLWIIAIYVSVIGVYEARYSRLPWAGRIPSFLKIEDPQVLYILSGVSRAATGVYRVQSKFGISLGLGEFLGMSVPFILHIMVTARRLWVRVAAFATLPMIFYVVLRTDSRLAVIGFFMSILIYLFFWASMRWYRHKDSLFGPLITLGYPAIFMAFIVLSFAWRRLEVLVWGGGAQQNSTDARRYQYEAGLRMVAKNPIGHGIGEGAQTLGYIAPGADMLTIDTYYLAVALEFGVVGFIVYYAMVVLGIWHSGKTAIMTRDPELAFMGAACIAMINFFISKSVFSQTENHPLMFIMLGLIVAAVFRERALSPATTTAARKGIGKMSGVAGRAPVLGAA
jgi:hypothetical protein